MKVICDYCKQPAKLVHGDQVYPHRPDLYKKRFWLCKPCEAYVGCHGKSVVPLGRLANAELRAAKVAAHAAFDTIWKSKQSSRTKAYSWLARQMSIDPSECHIGMFTVEQCRRVVIECERLERMLA